MIKKLLPLNQSWERELPIDSLIFHTTLGSSALSSWAWLDHIDLSYHYIIDDNGEVYKLVEHDRVSWHAGIVKNPIYRVIRHFKGINPNKSSIGIAFSRNGHKNLNSSQVEACVKLIKDNNWQDLPFFAHINITSHKPKEVKTYMEQVQEAMEGDKGNDTKIILMKQLIQLLMRLIEELKK